MPVFPTLQTVGPSPAAFLNLEACSGVTALPADPFSSDDYAGIYDPLRTFRTRLDQLYDHSILVRRPRPMESAWTGLLSGNAVCFSRNESGDAVLKLIREAAWVEAFKARNRMTSDEEIFSLLREIAAAVDRKEMTLDRQMENFLRSTMLRIKDATLIPLITWDPSFLPLRDLFVEAAWKKESATAGMDAEILDYFYEMVSLDHLFDQIKSVPLFYPLLQSVLMHEADPSTRRKLASEMWESHVSIAHHMERHVTREGVAAAAERLLSDEEIPRIIKELGPEKTLEALLRSIRPKAVAHLETFFDNPHDGWKDDDDLTMAPETLEIFLKLQERSPKDDVVTTWRKLRLSLQATLKAKAAKKTWRENFLDELTVSLRSLSASSEEVTRHLPRIFRDLLRCVHEGLHFCDLITLETHFAERLKNEPSSHPRDTGEIAHLTSRVFGLAPLDDVLEAVITFGRRELFLSIVKMRMQGPRFDGGNFVSMLVDSLFPKSASTRSKVRRFGKNADDQDLFLGFLSSCLHLVQAFEDTRDLEAILEPFIDDADLSSWTPLAALLEEFSIKAPGRGVRALKAGSAHKGGFLEKIEKAREVFREES